MRSVARFGAVVVAIAVLPSAIHAQGLRFSGAVQVSTVSFKTSSPNPVSMSGLGIGGLVRVSGVWLAQLELRYEQAGISTADGGTAQDLVEGDLLLGIRVLPWLTVKTGPSVRASVTDLGTEKWVSWEARIRGDVRLIGTAVRGYAEAWSVLSGNVNLNDDFGEGQGVEGGLAFDLFGSFWGEIGYRFDRDVLAGDVRTDITEKLYVRFGLGGT